MRLRLLVPLPVLAGLCAAITVYAVAGPSTGRLRIPTQSMEPTLRMGTKVTVNRDAYGDGAPQRGDVVALPGDRLAVRHGRVGSTGIRNASRTRPTAVARRAASSRARSASPTATTS